MSVGISLGQESRTVLVYFDKAVNEFKLEFDGEIEMSFYVGSSDGFEYDRLYGLSLRV